MATKSFTKTIIISDKDAIKKLKEKKVSNNSKMQKILSEINSTPKKTSNKIKDLLKKY